MKRGKCKLCSAVADLHDSHYLPKGGYKRMRASGLRNPNPVVLSGFRARQSSLQVRDYKFCSACEKRFNGGGEAWILKRIPQNYGDPFWLHSLLNSKTPILSGKDLLFPQVAIPEVDMARLVYFALSIFWRGTRVWSPIDGGRPPKLCLGRQEKAIRSFLLGKSKLPEDVVVIVAVWPYRKVAPAALVPRRVAARDGYRRYRFYYFGFIFLLAVGEKIPARLRRTCSYRSAEKFLTLSLELGSSVKEDIETQVFSRDRSKLEGMLKEIQALRSKTAATI
jgi:hypothetical protein